MIFKWFEIICTYPRDPNNSLTPVSVTQNNMSSLRVCDEIPCIGPSKLISVVSIPFLSRSFISNLTVCLMINPVLIMFRVISFNMLILVYCLFQDLPSIVSAAQVGMLDPHRKYFKDNDGERSTGHRWRFQSDRMKMKHIPNQFAPYEGIFGCGAECFTRRYDGTLFRFPLRESPSELSDNLYSPQKVLDLFECFQSDAHLALLFLKSLESIELYVRKETESSPRKIFQVKIASESLEKVRATRKEFIDSIKDLKQGEVPSSPISVTYPLTIECTTYAEQDAEQDHTVSHSYLVTNYFSGGDTSAELKKLMESEDLSYLPWVGVAMSVDPLKSKEDPQGHLFCFLPLPLQKKSLTGLPVHVNGFFALSQNRRHLKWPTADQEEGGKPLTDKALLWNKCLLKEVVPRAYADLLLQSIKMTREEIPVEVFYEAWPNLEKTDPKWQEILPLLFKELLSRAPVHTSADGGKWLEIKDAIFNTLEKDAETTPVLLRALASANTRIVTAPRHVMNVIDKHYGNVTIITPKLVRDVLRQVPSCYLKFTRGDKLLLLKYVLQDSCFGDLYNLDLLPLSNGTFTRFVQKDHSPCQPLYVSSEEHPQSLLPGLDHLFLDSSIKEDIRQQLETVATEGTSTVLN